jgi:hypothetical protein
MKSRKSVSQTVDEMERSGSLNLHFPELVGLLPDQTPSAILQALGRLQKEGRVVHVSRGAGHWLIVPLQHAALGAPPLEAWLDAYFRNSLKLPYYVGLLSAAEMLGSSPYGVMVTQVFVEKPRRSLSVGRHRLDFLTKTRIDHLPVNWHETPDGRLRISSPELTVCDLVQRHADIGGLARTHEVLKGLWSLCKPDDLAKVAFASVPLPVIQRLGALLNLDGAQHLAGPLAAGLHDRNLRSVSLEISPGMEKHHMDDLFKVWMPRETPGANS